MSVGSGRGGDAVSTDGSAQTWVVTGNPTDAELAAAVTAVVAAVSATASSSSTPAASRDSDSGWAAYWRSMRPSLPPGRDAWRASGQPHSPAT